jgi:mannose-6-phosphate isomerase-like protein (cupin superfamily)
MIRRQGTYEITTREKMRGGRGTVKIESFWSSAELKDKTRLCARLTLEPGTSIGFHEHVGEAEVFIVIRGQGQVSEGPGQPPVMVGAGDTILTGDGCGHAIEAVGSEPLEIIAVIVRF